MGLIFHAAVANAFSRCLGRLPRSPSDGTGTASRRRSTNMMSAPLPGLFGRKAPLGLGSWRVESVVDSQEPNSMFVFLFDDGSGEGWEVFPAGRISLIVFVFGCAFFLPRLLGFCSENATSPLVIHDRRRTVDMYEYTGALYQIPGGTSYEFNRVHIRTLFALYELQQQQYCRTLARR